MSIKVIISGGGTGGHIYPAIAIANAIKEIDSSAELLFVGADGKMEMEKVPESGYSIIGLPVRGFQRKISISTVNTLIRLFKSIFKSRKILKSFKPDIAIGVGGYASGPLCFVASRRGIPILLQEQNSYPGITNKILASKASKICVAYDGMERFFEKSKLIITGNPVRQDIINIDSLKSSAFDYYGLDSSKKTIVIIGGSLGARTLNESVIQSLEEIKGSDDVQIVWQTGSFYEEEINERLYDHKIDNLYKFKFLNRMDYIYSIADLIISRAGASTISELCLTAKPVILVPSPNVAEDHQTKNALALSSINSAILVKDKDAVHMLISTALNLVRKDEQLAILSNNIKKMGYVDSAGVIAKIVKEIVR